MKRSSFIVALFIVSFSGCSIGQNMGCSRPGIFSRLYNRIHGNDVGAPCASGACATGGYVSAPAMASSECEGCGGTTTMGYESYEGTPAYDSYQTPTNVYGGGIENVVPVPASR